MIPGLIARVRSLWRGVRRRTDVEAEMAEEFRLHLELRATELVRAGPSRGSPLSAVISSPPPSVVPRRDHAARAAATPR